MNFVEAIKTCFVRYTDFSGRSIRSEYWNFTVFILVLTFVCDYIDSLIAGVPYWDYTDAFGPLSIILIITTTIPSLAVSIRRLHDVNRSGWWMLLSITVIGLIPLIYWACKKGDETQNRFE
jgi:uncharacterized membrane protein YhaH (DUF805 family)